jgi:AbrB family looped-hinge helix DNA binding protein
MEETMASIMKISPQGQIRIPKAVMATLKIGPGDYVEIDLEADHVVLKPRKLIDPQQGWYWTPEWQCRENEASEDSKEGRVSPEFQTVEQGLRWLKE